MISPDDVVVATERHVSCSAGEEAVVLHLENGVYYGLNPVGARIWELIQRPTTLKDIVSSIAEEFDVERRRCEDDVRELLVELTERSLALVQQRAAEP